MKFDFSDETGKIGANLDNILVKFDIGDPPPSNVGESRWQQWLKSRTSRISAAMVKRNGSGDEIDLTERLLALGTASVMAMVLPLEASAAVIPAVNPSSIDLTVQGLDIDGDGLDDISGLISSTTNSWTNLIYASMVGMNGAEVSGSLGACLPGGSGVAVGNLNGFQSSCLLLDNFNTENPTLPAGGESTGLRFLGIKTSSGKFGWAKVQVDVVSNSLQVLDWAYESCDGDEIVTGAKTGGKAVCEVPPLPLPPLPPPVVSPSDNQVTLVWIDNNQNETGFKIYRDGKLIKTLLANATSYTDTGLPCSADAPYIYSVVATNSRGDSAPAIVPVTIGNVCPYYNRAMLFTAADGTGSGKVTSLPNLVSCEVSDCRDDPNDASHQICDKEKCSAQVDIHTVIKLIPQADSGSKFSSWGGHPDCVDGEVVMTENKLCVAYFHSNGAKQRPPEPTLPIILPNLGPGQAVCHHGEAEETTAQFSGGVSVNGNGRYLQTATVKSFVDQIDIQGKIKVDSQHLSSLTSDIFVYLSYQATVQDAPTFWMVDEQKKFWPWDGKPVSLVPFQTGVSLTANDELTVNIYQGTMQDTGIVQIFFGYRLGNGTVVCNFAGPLELNVRDK